jgi:hypothetical protein
MAEESLDFTTTIFERARQFFEGIGGSSRLTAQVAEADRLAHFYPLNGEPFYVRVEGGKVEFGKAEQAARDVTEGLCIIELEDALDAIFKGDLTLGEAMFHQKIRIPGYRNREPEIASFSRLLRFGVWDAVSGSHLLMPSR